MPIPQGNNRPRGRAGGRRRCVRGLYWSAFSGAGGVNGMDVRYWGQEVTLKGETGRFVLPPDIRKSVRSSSNDQRMVYLHPSADLPCIVGFGLSRGKEFEIQQTRQYDDGKIDLRTLQQRLSNLYGSPGYVFDDSGRFVMPDSLLRHAEITDRIYIHGAGPEFWIFSPHLTTELGPGWDHIRIGCETAMERVKPGARSTGVSK